MGQWRVGDEKKRLERLRDSLRRAAHPALDERGVKTVDYTESKQIIEQNGRIAVQIHGSAKTLVQSRRHAHGGLTQQGMATLLSRQAMLIGGFSGVCCSRQAFYRYHL